MTTTEAIRERQAEVVSDAILDALVDRLELQDPADVSLPQVAADAGVSIRTLYRYFPTRDALFAAVGSRIVWRVGLPTHIDGADDIAASFLRASGALSGHPRLARSLLHSSLGRLARGGYRRERINDVMAAVAEVADHLEPVEARSRAAVIANLCSAAAFVTVSEEGGLAVDEARTAVAWAITTLIDAMRNEGRRARNEQTGVSRGGH